jgi:hypothetical protein
MTEISVQHRVRSAQPPSSDHNWKGFSRTRIELKFLDDLDFRSLQIVETVPKERQTLSTTWLREVRSIAFDLLNDSIPEFRFEERMFEFVVLLVCVSDARRL